VKTTAKTILAFAFTTLMGIGLSSGCEKKQTESPESGDDEKASTNLCKEYETCDACIAGQQEKGADEGTAQTECGAAVVGCWTTWEKPITCNGSEMTNEAG
jgi:hypothetical protein